MAWRPRFFIGSRNARSFMTLAPYHWHFARGMGTLNRRYRGLVSSSNAPNLSAPAYAAAYFRVSLANCSGSSARVICHRAGTSLLTAKRHEAIASFVMRTLKSL